MFEKALKQRDAVVKGNFLLIMGTLALISQDHAGLSIAAGGLGLTSAADGSFL